MQRVGTRQIFYFVPLFKNKIGNRMRGKLLIVAVVLAAALPSFGDLLHPDVLRMPDGTRIASAKEWSSKARPQILDFFEKNVYGEIPPRPAKLEFVLAEKGDDALGGLAKRR